MRICTDNFIIGNEVALDVSRKSGVTRTVQLEHFLTILDQEML